MVSRVLLVGVVLAISVTTATAQDAVRSPRDVASGQSSSLMVEAANPTSTAHWIELESVSLSVRETGSGQATGKRTHKPVRVRTTLAPGAAKRSWSLGEMQSGAVVVESGAVVTANIDGQQCTFRAVIRRQASNSYAIEIGGSFAGWFKADGKLDQARCNAS